MVHGAKGDEMHTRREDAWVLQQPTIPATTNERATSEVDAQQKPSRARCATTPMERIGRGVVGVFLAAVAFSGINVLCAIPAGICSACMIVGAITGYCPTDAVRLLRRRGDTRAPR